MAATIDGRTRVLVVEDHAALGEALLFAFGFEPDIEVVGLAPTVEAAVEMAAASRPDVVLMDVRLPDGSGIEATSRVLEVHPAAAVVVLTAHADPVFALRAADAGAAGFMAKDVRIARIVATVRAVRAGQVAVEPTVLRSLLAQAAADGPTEGDSVGTGEGPAGELRADQLAVLGYLAQGVGPEAIAGQLGLDDADVELALTGALQGLGARSRLEAVVLAARRGLLSAAAG
jgi:DNA-binding NarL/FixJ family response regulator